MLSPISGFHMPGLQYILRLGSFMIPINIMIPMTLFISSSEAFFTWREPPLVITCCRVQSQTWFFAIDCSCHRLNNSSGLEFLLLPAKLGLRRRGISLILPEFVGCVHSFGPFKHNLFFLVWLQYKPRANRYRNHCVNQRFLFHCPLYPLIGHFWYPYLIGCFW